MAGVCVTAALQVPAARRNPAPEAATIGGAVSAVSACAILDSVAQTAQRERVRTTVTTMDGV